MLYISSVMLIFYPSNIVSIFPVHICYINFILPISRFILHSSPTYTSILLRRVSNFISCIPYSISQISYIMLCFISQTSHSIIHHSSFILLISRLTLKYRMSTLHSPYRILQTNYFAFHTSNITLHLFITLSFHILY